MTYDDVWQLGRTWGDDDDDDDGDDDGDDGDDYTVFVFILLVKVCLARNRAITTLVVARREVVICITARSY